LNHGVPIEPLIRIKKGASYSPLSAAFERMLSRITRKSMSSRAPLIGVTFEAQSLKIGYVILAAALSRQDVINFDSPLIR
jgi:hypothetical protein